MLVAVCCSFAATAETVTIAKEPPSLVALQNIVAVFA
jgi:hypothetical protein